MIKYLSCFIASILLPAAVLAWEPAKPVNVYVGFAPGSGNELSFRGVSSIIERQNKNINFVVQNRPGADGVVAMNDFITRPADGYHVYVPSHQGIWVTAEYFNRGAVKYTLNDFEYVITIAKSPLALVVPYDSPITTVPTFINHVRYTTKPISIAAGSGSHKLAYNYIANQLKLNGDLIKTVSYKGPAQAVLAVAAKEVEYGVLPVAVAQTMTQSNKVRILAVFSEQRLAQLPHVPLMHDYVAGANVYAAWGIILPKGTPRDVVDWYVKTFADAVRSPDAQRFFNNNLMFSVESELTPRGFENSMKQLRKQWIPILASLPVDQ
jgi:tripartite-type tricarboxylate transporter receptor subunit TctC